MKDRFKEILNRIRESKDEKITENTRILLVDGLNLFLRNFCIINSINTSGHHIGGLVGSLKSLGYAIKLINPTKVILCFDGQGSSASKKNLYPDYKANRGVGRITNYTLFNNREEENQSINDQMHRLIQYFSCLPLAMTCIDGLEADDIIGYLIKKYELVEDCKQLTIMSADQDFLQLISKKTQVYSPVKKRIFQSQQIIEEYEVHPNNFIIRKSLLGDTSDNLPGVDGLGPVKLKKLFPELLSEQTFSLENVFEKSKVGEHLLYSRIIERQKQLEINYKLMNLKENVISPDNASIIENSQVNALNKHQFLKMYYGDLLGNNIQGVERWITECFNDLNVFLKLNNE